MKHRSQRTKPIFTVMAITFVAIFFILAFQTTAGAAQPMVAAGWTHAVGLKSDGTVVAVGNNDLGQCDVFDWDLKPTVGGEAINPPTAPNIGGCDSTCQANAPMTVASSAMDVNFDYTAPVEVMGGVMSEDFSTVWWLTGSCTLSEDFGQAASNSEQFSCANVAMPLVSDHGWVFWLVAPSATANFGGNEWWNIGA